MKKHLFIFFLLPSLIFAQYYGERSTEQSFEYSDIFFRSHYLNTFGMNSFKDVAAGLVDDPFLNLYINPANMPKLKDNGTLLYLDFRGDRTTAPVVDNYVRMDYFIAMPYMPVIDPRWNGVSRSEPEPTFTLGILTYPVPELSSRLFVGATYQFIHREEKFYTLPYWIYNSRYYYDSFGNKAEGMASVPIQDRFSGKDEMTTTGHLYSAFAGYNFDDNWSAGIGINGVIHDRKGGYLNSSSDEYGNTDKTDWENSYSQDKDQSYSHLDFTFGLNYSFSDKIRAGLKAGMLSGKAEQDYNSGSRNIYIYNVPSENQSWNNNYSKAATVQNWTHDGTNKYFGLNFDAALQNGRSISAYYKYSRGDEDFNSSSAITDTSFYQSHYIYDYTGGKNIYDYSGKNSTRDFRTGNGSRNTNSHEAMLRFSWKLNSSTTLVLGGYWNKTENEINNLEPVNAYRYYEYHSESKGQYPGNYDNLYELTEIKNLQWEYSSNYWTFQIPVLVNFELNENFGLMLGINRIIRGWEIKDRTTAYFTSRKRNQDGEIKEEKNFGERYTQPDENITENETKAIAKFYASVTESFKVNLLLDPEFEKQFRIAQWWLGFEINL